jgi:hypothetical protein
MGEDREATRGRGDRLLDAAHAHHGARAPHAGQAGSGEAQRWAGHLHGLQGAQVRHSSQERSHLLGFDCAAD